MIGIRYILDLVDLRMTVPHIPVLRRGRAYESLEKSNIVDCRTGEVLATLSQVNAGIVRKDLSRVGESRGALKQFTVARLLEICAQAGAQFLEGTLPLGGGVMQSPRQYLESLSVSSGLPHVMVRRNMAKIHAALTNMPAILKGLTRGLDLSVLDTGHGGRLCFYPAALSLGLVMPSNSPAV